MVEVVSKFYLPATSICNGVTSCESTYGTVGCVDLLLEIKRWKLGDLQDLYQEHGFGMEGRR